MGIPGRTLDRVETRAKVRIGVKKESKGGRKYPAAVDYFVCDDPEFPAGQPKTLTIQLPYATAAENFTTGLERWLKAKSGNGQVLTCYTHDDGAAPTALRLTDFLQGGEELHGEPRGQRTPILCGADACPWFKDKTCKPMGRLQFFLAEGRVDEALQFDTKSWNTIEQIVPALKAAERRNPDLRGRTFELSVAFVSKGTDRFPVVSIKEVGVPIHTVSDAYLGDVLILADLMEDKRQALANLLDAFRPGWREDAAYIARIKEVGIQVAYEKTREAALAKLGPS